MAWRVSLSQILVVLFYGGQILLYGCHGCTAPFTLVKHCVDLAVGNQDPCTNQVDVQCLKALEPCESIDSIIRLFEYYCSATGKADKETLSRCLATSEGFRNRMDEQRCFSQSGFNVSLRDNSQCMSAQKFRTCQDDLLLKYCNDEDILRLVTHERNGFLGLFCYKESIGSPKDIQVQDNIYNTPGFIGRVAAGGAFIIIIIAVIIMCVFVKKKRAAPPATARPALPTPNVATPTTAYELPAVASNFYEEVFEHGPTVTTPRQYERLNMNARLQQWMVDHNLDDMTEKKLRQHGISTIDDVHNLSHADMMEMGLNVAERNRIKKATGSITQKY